MSETKLGRVKVVGKANGPMVGNRCALYVDDKLVPVYSAEITIKPGNLVRAKIEVDVNEIDMEFAQNLGLLSKKESV